MAGPDSGCDSLCFTSATIQAISKRVTSRENASLVDNIFFFFKKTGSIVPRNIASLKPVLNWANICSPERTSDTSTNYDSFLN